jgi:hypothetical protein
MGKGRRDDPERGRTARPVERPAGGPVLSSGAVTERPASAAASGGLRLRPAPAGLPVPDLAPPVVAESGDPFATLRIVEFVARIERGRPVRLDDLVDALNARHLDWLFDSAVVANALIALQANWMADYRNASGIVLDDGPLGPTVALEDSPRVDPWIVGQARRMAAACHAALAEFARRDGVNRLG